MLERPGVSAALFGGSPGEALVDVAHAVPVGVGEEVDELHPVGGCVGRDGPQCQPLVSAPRALRLPSARSRRYARSALVQEDQDWIVGAGPWQR